MTTITVKSLTRDGKLDFGFDVEIGFELNGFVTSMVAPFYDFSCSKDTISFTGEENHTFEICRSIHPGSYILVVESFFSKHQPMVKFSVPLSKEQTKELLNQMDQLAVGTEYESKLDVANFLRPTEGGQSSKWYIKTLEDGSIAYFKDKTKEVPIPLCDVPDSIRKKVEERTSKSQD